MDYPSLFNLALVSKHIHPHAIRALYHKPFMISMGKESTPTWDKAFELLHTLEANNNRYGRLVRDTSGIEIWQRRLVRPSIDLDNRCLAPVVGTWYVRALKACPSLQKITLSFATSKELDKILRTLNLISFGSSSAHSSQAQPRVDFSASSISFSSGPSRPGVDGRITYAEVLHALQRTSIQTLDTVEFDEVDWILTDQFGNSSSPSFPFPMKSLSISKSSDQSSNSTHLFPRFPSTLERFSFVLRYTTESDVDTRLPKITAPKLKELSMSHIANQCHALSSYTSSGTAPPIVVSTFTCFPRLTTLYLYGTHGPSLLLLETLAQSSPLLSSIDFHASHWISTADPSSAISYEIFPEVRIFVTLQTMQHLREVDLGVLPTSDSQRYEGMKAMLELKGSKVKYKCCYVD